MTSVDPATQDTRSVLLHAALACFADHGFNGTSMRMIADRAMRPLSLLAHHFGNKEGLYVEVFRMILGSKVFARFPTLGDGPDWVPRDKADAVRAVREHIHLMYREVCQRLDQDGTDLVASQGPKLWLQEMQAPREELHPLLNQYFGPLAKTWKRAVQTLRPDLDEGQAIFISISVIGTVVSHGHSCGVNRVIWGTAKPVPNDFQAAELLVDLVLRGLVGPREG